MVREKLPDVTDCEPNVNTATALLVALVSLYRSAQSNAPELVKLDHDTEADGVQKATIPVPPVVDGALPLVTATPPAV